MCDGHEPRSSHLRCAARRTIVAFVVALRLGCCNAREAGLAQRSREPNQSVPLVATNVTRRARRRERSGCAF